MAGGLSFESFGATAKVNRDTLYEWAERHRDFSDAKTRGESLCLAFFERIGRAMLLGLPVEVNGKTLDPRKMNSGLWTFQMKARFRKLGWNPKSGGGEDGDDTPDGFGFNF
jgi:hypothetical protein